jgi:hypothetical protein
MRFARRHKILLNTEMDLQRAGFEPAAAALDKLRRLCLFG